MEDVIHLMEIVHAILVGKELIVVLHWLKVVLIIVIMVDNVIQSLVHAVAIKDLMMQRIVSLVLIKQLIAIIINQMFAVRMVVIV